MNEQKILFDLGIILLLGALTTGIFRKLRLPSATGLILAGILLSPFTPGYTVEGTKELNLIAQLGAILLMFTIGLQFDYRYLEKISLKAFTLAAVASTAAFAAGYISALALGFNPLQSILTAVFFISTSTTMGLKIIEEMNLRKIENAGIMEAAIIIDDLYGLIAFTLFTSGTTPNHKAVLEGAYIFAGVITLFLLGIKIVPKMLEAFEKQSKDSSLTVAAALCLILSYAVVSLNVSPIIGAFLAGTIMTSSIRSKNILETISPLVAVSGTVFFVSVGLQINPKLLYNTFTTSVILSAAALTSKAGAAALTLKKFKTPSKEAIMLGLSTGPRGEVLLIVAQSAVLSGFVGTEFLAIATSIVLLSSVATPLLIRSIKK